MPNNIQKGFLLVAILALAAATAVYALSPGSGSSKPTSDSGSVQQSSCCAMKTGCPEKTASCCSEKVEKSCCPKEAPKCKCGDSCTCCEACGNGGECKCENCTCCENCPKAGCKCGDSCTCCDACGNGGECKCENCTCCENCPK